MKRMYLQWFAFLFIFIISIGSIQNPFATEYIDGVKEESISVAKMADPLYEKIQSQAKKYEKPAIDAIVDKVWKAIPGYNGVKVDIEASYEKMKDDGQFNPHKLVFKETKPSVHLEDLPPAPIYKGNPEKSMVTLLVNVAWGNEYLPSMLKVMKKHEVKSTFFLDGSWVKDNPKLAKMILEEGHEIGNHAYSHPDMKSLTAARITEELQKTNEVIEATLDVTPKWFAPPSGSFRQEVVDIASTMDMGTIMWSVDTVDWRKPEPHTMVQNVLNKVHPGAMILMHPTSSTAAGLDQLIIGLKSKGYQIGTVTQLMDESRLSFGINED
ncbi:polysaccharide deacetylase family protein [Desertibacillus haloalkaliphilus]|uniref:polysaccharide deacetylase family protein n=1 Tax=Desertibacillus haloalkaliphilus TaxID=1328930 RepID=UPI001C25222C|nr:polysaccharide deacetylase family protein [Desertibacillus haloalkaliphilus]MBU8906964.1 polysaccharide deacetylase family protein [Desertibacillus haloalkaliphilus]